MQGDLVRALVSGGARVDGLQDDGEPLATALVFGYTSAAEALVACGARVDNLYFAAGLGDLDRVRGFFDETGALRAGALGSYAPAIAKELPAEPAAIVQEALHFAVTHGSEEVTRFLLERGADPNGRTSGHHCELPLLQAIFVHEMGLIPLLLEAGADPHARCGKRGASALEHVRATGPVGLVQLLEGA